MNAHLQKAREHPACHCSRHLVSAEQQVHQKLAAAQLQQLAVTWLVCGRDLDSNFYSLCCLMQAIAASSDLSDCCKSLQKAF